MLYPKSITRLEKNFEISIAISSKDKISQIIRKIVSYYLVGYTTIRIKTSEQRIPLEQRNKIKRFVRRMLVGTEIIADSKDYIALQVLLSYPELSVTAALRRTSIIAVSMHKDVMAALKDMDYELAKEVVVTDDEVDRFSFYIIRQLKAAVQDEKIIKEIGLSTPRDCLGYRLISKSVERVGDHAVNIARNILKIKMPIDHETFTALNEMSAHATLDVEDSVNALYTKDYNLADEVVERKKQIEGYEEKVIQKILDKKFDAETTSNLRLIVESIKRTAEYSSDIAEIVLNLISGDPTESL
ncbi:MAG: phosphate signaling complex PhoU family protein [Candidatus Ranarchaeia archaeon]